MKNTILGFWLLGVWWLFVFRRVLYTLDTVFFALERFHLLAIVLFVYVSFICLFQFCLLVTVVSACDSFLYRFLCSCLGVGYLVWDDVLTH